MTISNNDPAGPARTSCGRGSRQRMIKPASLPASQDAEVDRNRYYALLEDERRRLDFTVPEAAALVDALRSTVAAGPDYRRAICLAVEDAARLEDLAAKWDIEVEPLLEQLAHLSPGQAMAVIDAAERFWERVRETGPASDRSTLLHEVGLTGGASSDNPSR